MLAGAREVALAAVAEAFARNRDELLGAGPGRQEPRSAKNKRARGHRDEGRKLAKKRSPEELAKLGERLCTEICDKPGETMTYYAARLSSTPAKLAVPARRLTEEGRVHAIGERNQRKYYAGARE